MKQKVLLLLLAGLHLLTKGARADEVTYWNDVLLQAIRTSNTPPPRAAWGMAMMHTVAFDAVNSPAKLAVALICINLHLDTTS